MENILLSTEAMEKINNIQEQLMKLESQGRLTQEILVNAMTIIKNITKEDLRSRIA